MAGSPFLVQFQWIPLANVGWQNSSGDNRSRPLSSKNELSAVVEHTVGGSDASFLVGALETGFRVVNRRLQAAAGRAGEPPCRHGRRRGGGNRADDPSNTASGNNAGGVSQ